MTGRSEPDTWTEVDLSVIPIYTAEQLAKVGSGDTITIDGVDYTFQSKEIQDKGKKTNLEKYGFENAMQNKDIKAKSIATNKERYNGSGFQSNKTRETMLEIYGVEYTSQSKELYEKGRTTKQRRYGDKNYNNVEKQLETIHNKPYEERQATINKIKNTTLNKYGVTSGFKTKKAIDNMQKKYGGIGFGSKEIHDKTIQSLKDNAKQNKSMDDELNNADE